MLKCFLGVSCLSGVALSKQGWWCLVGWLFVGSGLLPLTLPVMYTQWGAVGAGLGMDGLSFSMIWLSIWVCGLMLTASFGVYAASFYPVLFMMLSISLLGVLILTFSALNLLGFYVSFEACLVPTLLLILGWGYQPERLQAGLYMMFYTLLASLPLLVSILYVYQSAGSLMFYVSWKWGNVSLLVYLGLVMAFLVSMPMYPMHLWLPSAHVEAPVAGSMILAGVLLSLGGYGLVRIMPFTTSVAMKMNFWWTGLSLFGGGVVSILCLRQTDMKSLVAYSSVAHMGLVICGITTLTSWGFNGALAMMLAHGLCSSCMFGLVNVVYERTGSRSLVINRGLMGLMPSMALWWFLLSACNMAAPPSLNLMGEIGLLTGVVNWSNVSMGALGVMSFFGAAYSLYLYAFSQHGEKNSGARTVHTGTVREFVFVILHWLPLNFLVMKGEMCFLWT